MTQKLQKGDRVQHAGNSMGSVVKVDGDGTVHVEFDHTKPGGAHHFGVYGMEWFARYPGVLKASSRETWGEWARGRFGNLIAALKGEGR